VQEDEKLKNYVSGAAYQHLRNFITEGLHLDPSELKAYHNALSNQQKIQIKNKKKILLNEETDNYFCEFGKLKRKIYKELDIEQKELKTLKKYINDGLTDTETKVVQLLKQGFSYRECAQKLFISETTVKTHVNVIFQKRGVNSLQELLVLELTGQVKGQSAENTSKDETNDDVLNLLNNLL
jgi:DNA-binding NarL/FixJ family response regulator